jgi:regulator of nonsense transcripts 3
MRHLPPRLTEEKLKEIIEPCPKHDYFHFVPGNPAHGIMGFARVYINFSNEDEIVPFRERYDGYVFEDEVGSKSYAVVEFAPFQRVPRRTKRKVDTKSGTLEADPDFTTFCATLKEEIAPLPGVDKTLYLLEDQKTTEVKTTTLIEYLKDKKERKEKMKAQKELKKKERRVKERSRRDKGKQRDMTVSVSIIKGSKTAESKGEMKTVHSRTPQASGIQAQPKIKPKVTSSEPERTKSSPVLLGPLSSKQKQDQSLSHDKASVRIIERPKPGQKRSEPQRQPSGGGTKPSSYNPHSEEGALQGERKAPFNSYRNKERPDRAMYVPRGRADHNKSGREDSDLPPKQGRGGGRPYSSRYRGGGRGRGGQHNRGKSYNERMS